MLTIVIIDMTYAVISDIHGNYNALDAVLEDLQRKNISDIVCLGDIIGYGPEPVECLQRIREMNIPCVKGNHDEYAYILPEIGTVNPMAEASAKWTAAQLDEEAVQWLKDLPMTHEDFDAIFTHASLDTKNEWVYVRDLKSAGECLEVQEKPICYVGHTHVPGAYVLNMFPRPLDIYSTIYYEADARCLINIGSVGQPRDNDPRAAYVVCDTDNATITLCRVEYPIADTQNKIRAAGLPERLATRLAEGF